jgi:hypothetical protein
MLKQALHWLMITASIADGLLLARVLGLRLHRLYVFITLDCVLGVLFDAVLLWLHPESQEYARVYIYTRYLYALLLPLIMWDVFEEAKAGIAKLLRLEAIRMMMSLLVIGVVGTLLTGVTAFSDEPEAADWPAVVGIFLWGGSCLASMVFVWKTRRGIRSEAFVVPSNTRVWSLFYILILAGSIFDFALLLTGWKPDTTQSDILTVVSILWGIGCTAWCIVRLRPVAREEVAQSQ